jgi:hypothetical protein
MALSSTSYLIYKNWDLITKTFDDFAKSNAGQKTVAVWNSIVGEITATVEVWKQIWNHPVVENWIKKFKEGMDSVGNGLKTVGQMFVTLWEVTKNLGLVLWEVGKAFVWISNAALDAYYSTEGAWESLKTFFTTIWEPVKPQWDAFIKKIQELDVVKKIIASWQELKTFFTTIWDDITPKWDKFTGLFSKLWGNVKSEVPEVGNLFAPDATKPSITSKLPPLSGAKAAPVTKNQNVNVAVNVNASKISDPREVAKQVSKEMKSFNWNYLFDPIGAVP